MRVTAGVGGRAARPIYGGRGCAGCAQDGNGGVVRMDDGAVMFKGGTISNTMAVSALRSHVACRKCSRLTLHVAHDAACHAVWVWRFEQGLRGMRAATMLQCVVYCTLRAVARRCRALCGAASLWRGKADGCCALYALCYRLSATRVERQRLPLCTLRVVCCM